MTVQGDDPYKDPWTEARQAKKARVQKNLGQQRKNMGIGACVRALLWII